MPRPAAGILKSLVAVGDRAAAALFAEGWRFFVPYLLVYLVCRLLDLPVPAARAAFFLLHGVLALLLVRYAWGRRGELRAADVAFWAGLLALFVLPGAYLEFPSDAWEHVRRIYKWGWTATVAENRFADRFPYFWSWTLIGSFPPGSRRLPLALLSAFFQLLVSHQFHRVAVRLGATPRWAKVQVLGVLFFFGNTAFGFQRYYALASTSVAYAAYLSGIIAGLDLAEGRRPRLGWPCAGLILIFCSHLQEVLLAGVSALALLGHALWRYGSSRGWLGRTQQRIAVGGVLVGVAALQLAPRDLSFPPASALPVLGLLPALGLPLAAVLWHRMGALATLCLTPALVLAFPPTDMALAALVPVRGLEWRVLYAFPTSFALVAAARLGLSWLSERTGAGWRRLAATALAAAAIAVALRPAAPYFGRLWFVLHRPSDDVSLTFVDEAADWLWRNRVAARASWRERRRLPGDASFVDANPPPYADEPGACLLITDKASAFGLGAQLGNTPPTRRRTPPEDARLDLDSFLARIPVCAFLVAHPPPGFAAGESPVARASGHWQPDLVRLDLEGGTGFPALQEELRSRGWTATDVPPFYSLWEPRSEPVP